jgi:integrase
VIARKAGTLTPPEYERLLGALRAQHRVMVETLIEAGLRWGELIALKPRHIDFLRRSLTVEETIVEVSKKHSPTGQRYLLKPYPKDNGPRTFGVRQAWLDAIAAHIKRNGIGHDDQLFPSRAGTPISRNNRRSDHRRCGRNQGVGTRDMLPPDRSCTWDDLPDHSTFVAVVLESRT